MSALLLAVLFLVTYPMMHGLAVMVGVAFIVLRLLSGLIQARLAREA